jgi:hypothetical protein
MAARPPTTESPAMTRPVRLVVVAGASGVVVVVVVLPLVLPVLGRRLNGFQPMAIAAAGQPLFCFF